MSEKKDVKYLNKDFGGFRDSLVEFSKVYFPSTYNDFNPTSPGMMFMEMAAYVGDVLSYYIDKQLQETMIMKAQEYKNVITIAQGLGYTPQITNPSFVDLDMYMVVPKIGTGDDLLPDYRYALTIKSGVEVSSLTDSAIKFQTSEDVVFSNTGSINAPEVTVYELEGDTPKTFLLKKKVKAYSATIETKELEFTAVKRYNKGLLDVDDLISIIGVEDSDGNTWYETDYLAQDTIFEEESTKLYPDYASNNDTTPYMLRLKRVPRRFVKRLNKDGLFELCFGSGVSSNPDELIIPAPGNVGSNLPDGIQRLDTTIDPSNFLYTKTYGQVPTNTTLTVTCARGGGIESNVPSNDLTDINTSTIEYDLPDDDNSISEAYVSAVVESIEVNNPEAAVGGKGKETLEEIKQNAIAHFSTQQRVVTKEDYIVRVYNMPAKYGNVAKVYITADKNLIDISKDDSKEKLTKEIDNPMAMNLYVLGFDNNKNLTMLNNAVKANIITYLDRYRILTDAVNILDAFIINIGCTFDIITAPSFNKNDVLLRCIDTIYDFFDNDNWQINQPIVLGDIYRELMEVRGVQNVNDVKITCKYDEDLGYSGNFYDITKAKRDGIVFPSIDPSIFELKYRNDIRGRAK